MAEGHLKFRCYRCNQLLGASSRRAGTVISCPRCSAELEVPRPDELATSAAADASSPPSSRGARSSAAVQGTSAAVSSFIEEIAAAIPAELAALRPEDVRVEAEFANRVVRTREPAIPILPARVEAPPEPEAPSVEALQTVQPAQRVQTPRRVGPPPQAPVRPDPLLTVPVNQAQPAALIDASLPAIQVDPPSILPPGRQIRPVSEVVLQPATVLAWSLLVLLAVPMAFLAGLLLGHFVWK
jgi:phage FluMu protein Com